MITVTLSWEEIDKAARIGQRQVVRAMKHGWEHRGGGTATQRPLWEHQITAYIGECAVAKWLKLPFAPDLTNFTRRPDVADWEVRSTRHPAGCLAVGPKDFDDRMYMLVVVHEPTVDIIGWAFGKDAKMLGEWQTKLGCWYLGQQHLMEPFE